ncbi:MAG: hypothetical protein II961_10180 [Candidatus Riflebacteria bacterium]|nr:hypothetical protein [Candidatus Riflebacteria bacterium]
MQKVYYKDNKRVMDHLIINKSKKDLFEYIDKNEIFKIISIALFSVLLISCLIFSVLGDSEDILGEYSSNLFQIAFIITIIEFIVVFLIGFLYYYIFLSKKFFICFKTILSFLPLLLIYVVATLLLNHSIITYLNKKLDNSEAITYYVKIVNKKVNKGKSERYYLTITPWRPYNYYIVFKTDTSTYYTFSKGDVTKVQVKKGYWGFEYFVTRYGLKKVDLNFPSDHVYALTEEEANKIIEKNNTK